MMRVFTVICALAVFSISQSAAQSKDTIYYDRKWKEIENKNYKFYRVTTPYKGFVQITDFYESGKIQMTGTYKTTSFDNPVGQFLYYNKNGHFYNQKIYDPLKYPTLLSEFTEYLNLLSPFPDSFYISVNYRKSGSVWAIGYVMDDSCSCKSRWLYISKEGDLWFQMSYSGNKKDGRYIAYFYNKNIMITGQFKERKKSGKWIYYNPDGTVKEIAYYINGKKMH